MNQALLSIAQKISYIESGSWSSNKVGSAPGSWSKSGSKSGIWGVSGSRSLGGIWSVSYNGGRVWKRSRSTIESITISRNCSISRSKYAYERRFSISRGRSTNQ